MHRYQFYVLSLVVCLIIGFQNRVYAKPVDDTTEVNSLKYILLMIVLYFFLKIPSTTPPLAKAIHPNLLPFFHMAPFFMPIKYSEQISQNLV
jgi:hypothetical protein